MVMELLYSNYTLVLLGTVALAGGMLGEGSNIGTVPDGWQVC
ncbi:hypothetical protein GBAR_LOCUS11771 [Geodia barretti]|uniref:Uncharacterized protein n=1 Tax=Geodia barretti TaxID=519541 RepID=A0AA35RZU2_GEOBA|nr:hypothetical protein GBAR_LOCUS11771 [Geodia barretti]